MLQFHKKQTGMTMISTTNVCIFLLISGFANTTFCMEKSADRSKILLKELKDSLELLKTQTVDFTNIDSAHQKDLLSQLENLEYVARTFQNHIKSTSPATPKNTKSTLKNSRSTLMSSKSWDIEISEK